MGWSGQEKHPLRGTSSWTRYWVVIILAKVYAGAVLRLLTQAEHLVM